VHPPPYQATLYYSQGEPIKEPEPVVEEPEPEPIVEEPEPVIVEEPEPEPVIIEEPEPEIIIPEPEPEIIIPEPQPIIKEPEPIVIEEPVILPVIIKKPEIIKPKKTKPVKDPHPEPITITNTPKPEPVLESPQIVPKKAVKAGFVAHVDSISSSSGSGNVSLSESSSEEHKRRPVKKPRFSQSSSQDAESEVIVRGPPLKVKLDVTKAFFILAIILSIIEVILVWSYFVPATERFHSSRNTDGEFFRTKTDNYIFWAILTLTFLPTAIVGLLLTYNMTLRNYPLGIFFYFCPATITTILFIGDTTKYALLIEKFFPGNPLIFATIAIWIGVLAMLTVFSICVLPGMNPLGHQLMEEEEIELI